MTDNQSTEKDELSAIQLVQVEMQEKVRRLATPCEPGESVKSCVRRVSMVTGLTFSQVRRLWYSEWRVVPAHVADRIREAKEQHERRLDAQAEARRARYAALYPLTHEGHDREFYRARAGLDD